MWIFNAYIGIFHQTQLDGIVCVYVGRGWGWENGVRA